MTDTLLYWILLSLWFFAGLIASVILSGHND